MCRPSAIAAVRMHCPQLAGLLATSWQQGARVWARAGEQTREQRISFRGGAQGRLSTQVAFCARIHEMLESVSGRNGAGIIRVGIVDDQYHIGLAPALAAAWPEMEHRLAEARYELRRQTCKVWAPGKEAGLSVGAHMRIGLLTTLIPESEGSFALLGAAAEGRWSTVLGQFAGGAAPAMARAATAE